jgi:flagellar basal-body rod modification protein FlgD
MASVGSTGDTPKGTSIWSATTDTKGKKTGTDGLGKDDFMKLMLTQLQHQDPLKPMDDQAFIAQTAQFNALDEMTKLNTTMTNLLQSQQLAEASGMIGKVVSALDTDGKPITGTVTGASVEKGASMLHIGAKKVAIDKVSAVASDEASLPTLEAPTDSTGTGK